MARGNNDREMDWRDRRPRSRRSHGDREDQGSSSRRRRDAAPRDEEPPRVDVGPPHRQRALEVPAKRAGRACASPRAVTRMNLLLRSIAQAGGGCVTAEALLAAGAIAIYLAS
jgi:hypothetical protein